MISPFTCYTLSFLLVVVVYLFGWSELYPGLSGGLLAFLAITILTHIGSHLFLKPVSFKKLDQEKLPVIGTTIFIFILWTVEFIYEGGIPLIKILFHMPYNYRLFGVPSLHVFVVTFSSFFTVYLFHLYISKRLSAGVRGSKLLLLLYLLNLSAALLIYSRAMLFFNISASIIVYMMSVKKLPYGKMAIIAAMIIPLLFLFGVLGSLRVSREAHESYNNENFMDTGAASESFRHSIIPKEFFWTYIYMSSPLANLQYNIDENKKPVVTGSSLFWGTVYETLPDFITKRMHSYRGTLPPKEYRINFSFNMSTVYSRSFSYAKWGGIVMMGIFLLIFPWVFVKILDRESDFFVTGWAILCTMYLFTSYDNTFRFTGLSLQLAYPVLLSFSEKYLSWFKR